MLNEPEDSKEVKKLSDKDNTSSDKDVFFIERRILKYFQECIGDTYKDELEAENERKRNIQTDI